MKSSSYTCKLFPIIIFMPCKIFIISLHGYIYFWLVFVLLQVIKDWLETKEILGHLDVLEYRD